MKFKTKFAAALLTALIASAAFVPAALADEPADASVSDGSQVTAETPAPAESVKIVSPSSLVKTTFTKNGCTYKITSLKYSNWSTGKATVSLVKYNSSKKSATVPNTVGKSFKFSADSKTAVASHTVSFAVTEIAANAFNNAKGHKIAKATVGANVEAIGNKAFKGCSKLKKIVIKGEKIMQVGANKGSIKAKKLTKLKKKWKSCSAFKSVPRSCKVTVPKPKGFNFGYAENVRQLFGYAGFKGVVSW